MRLLFLQSAKVRKIFNIKKSIFIIIYIFKGKYVNFENFEIMLSSDKARHAELVWLRRAEGSAFSFSMLRRVLLRRLRVKPAMTSGNAIKRKKNHFFFLFHTLQPKFFVFLSPNL